LKACVDSILKPMGQAQVPQVLALLTFLGACLASVAGFHKAPIARHADGLSFGNATVHALLCVNDRGREDPRAQLLMSKLATFGYKVKLVDCDDMFKGHAPLFGLRMRHYREAIADMPDDGLFVILDSFDVVVFGTAAEAAERFQKLNVPLLASCTVATWPPVTECPAYETILSPYADQVPLRPNMYNAEVQCKFPCGGAMMGYKAAFLALYDHNHFDAATDDQCWLHTTLSDMAPGKEWALDYNSELFLEYQSIPRYKVRVNWAGRLEISASPSMQTHPTFVHLDGLHPGLAEMQSFYN